MNTYHVHVCIEQGTHRLASGRQVGWLGFSGGESASETKSGILN